MTFLVSWRVSQTVPTFCPDFKSDPYTGKYPDVMCTVYHTKTVEVKMKKEFETMVQVKEFIKNRPPEMKEEDFIVKDLESKE